MARSSSERTTNADVHWVEEIFQMAHDALAEPFQPCFVMHDYKEQNATFERDGDGYAPRKELFTGLITQFELPFGLAETLRNDYKAGFPSACVLFPDAIQTLYSLRVAGLKLGLITNGSVRMQSRKLECLALLPMLDTTLISDAEGIHKPDREIFHRALQRLNANPARAVFVGDHPEVDVAGARAAGTRRRRGGSGRLAAMG